MGDLDNVLYEISNETQPDSAAWQHEIVSFIKSYQAKRPKQHPVGMTTHKDGPSTADVLASKADWMSVFQAAPPYQYRTDPPPADGGKVSLPDTDHLWGAAAYDRTWIWKCFLRGHNPLYMDMFIQVFPPLGKVERNAFLDHRRNPVRHAMGETRRFAGRIDLARMVPSVDLSTTGYCLANPGKEYLVYQPGSGSFGVSLEGGEYAAEWHNPATGGAAGSQKLKAAGGSQTLTPPFPGDAVLYIRRAN